MVGMVWPEKDPTSHAETNCIKQHTKITPYKFIWLHIVFNLESCSMCLGLDRGQDYQEVFEHIQRYFPNPYELSAYSAKVTERLTPFNDTHKMEVVGEF